jgi:hypothetical protein
LVDVLSDHDHVVLGLVLLVLHCLDNPINHLAHRLRVQGMIHVPEVVPLRTEVHLTLFIVREVDADLWEQALGSLVHFLHWDMVHPGDIDALELVGSDELG